MSLTDDGLRPIVPYLVNDENGEPALQGSKCGACGEVFLGVCKVCARCCARGTMAPIWLAKSGSLYNYTTVYRSNPDVSTPFVSAIVDLDGGGTIMGNLVAPQNDIKFDMRVKLVFNKADAVDAKGRSYLTYHFVKA